MIDLPIHILLLNACFRFLKWSMMMLVTTPRHRPPQQRLLKAWKRGPRGQVGNALIFVLPGASHFTLAPHVSGAITQAWRTAELNLFTQPREYLLIVPCRSTPCTFSSSAVRPSENSSMQNNAPIRLINLIAMQLLLPPPVVASASCVPECVEL